MSSLAWSRRPHSERPPEPGRRRIALRKQRRFAQKAHCAELMPGRISLANPSRFMVLVAPPAARSRGDVGCCLRCGALSFLHRARGLPARRDGAHHVSACAFRLARAADLCADVGLGYRGLVWRHPLAEVSLEAAAPIGCAFTFLCLVTGSLWGKQL